MRRLAVLAALVYSLALPTSAGAQFIYPDYAWWTPYGTSQQYTVVTGMGNFTVQGGSYSGYGYTPTIGHPWSAWGYGGWYPSTTQSQTTYLGTCPPAWAYFRGYGC
jgi:hypothetical protein